jgi:hypothetical protein
MSALNIGRNDSCPCGSGKKYKRCCLPKEEAQAAATRPREVPDEVLDEEERAAPVRPLDAPERGMPPITADPRNIPWLLKELGRKAPKKDRALYKSLLAETGPLLEYFERQPEI